MERLESVKSFWNSNPCGSRSSDDQNRSNYFKEVASKRYDAEFHIPEIAKFENFKDRDVLEIGCGLGTDGLQFAKAGARYVGVDLTPAAVSLSKEHFSLFNINGIFFEVNAEKLPFPDNNFDHVYSFGVIHHSPDIEAIVREIYRVLKPNGTFCIMIYNKSSINYYLEIMFFRKIFKRLLYPAFMPSFLSKCFGFSKDKLEEHRKILWNAKKISKEKWISINTDGPNCPLARVYNKEEAFELFRKFEDIRSEVRFFDKSHWPLLRNLLPKSAVSWLGNRWGWHRMVYGKKPSY